MNFKKYHVSKNLYVDKIDNAIINSSGIILSRATDNYNLYIAPVIAGETYSLDDSLYYGFFASYPNVGDTTYNGAREKAEKFIAPINGYVAVRYDISITTPMINEGLTPLPYEPYSSEVWHDIPHYIHNTSTDTITTLPADIYADGNNATVGLKGNTVQNGTPTPSNPVEVNGVGVRTENLLDMEASTDSVYINSLGEITYNDTWSVSDYIPIKSLTSYTISRITDQSTIAACHAFYDANKSLISTIQAEVSTQTFETPTNAKYIRCSWRSATIQQVMLNLGSTAKPYEPYGYKIPISSGGVTTNIYLGSTQTVRAIKKVVFDGSEDWQGADDTVSKYLFIWNYDYKVESGVTCMSTHYSGANNIVSGDNIPNNSACFYKDDSTRVLYLKGSEPITLADFKAYLAQQYANGTPVTVWYVLATPTTGMVNEPIRKIGNYADTVSGITIPTIAGANSFDVLTTLKPSEASLSYTGWHDTTVQEWDGSQWNE